MIRNLARNNKLFGVNTTDELNSAFQHIDDRVSSFEAPSKEAKSKVSNIRVYSNNNSIRIDKNQSYSIDQERYFNVEFHATNDIQGESVLPVLRLDTDYGNMFGYCQYKQNDTTFILETYISGSQVFVRFVGNKVEKNIKYRIVILSA